MYSSFTCFGGGKLSRCTYEVKHIYMINTMCIIVYLTLESTYLVLSEYKLVLFIAMSSA